MYLEINIFHIFNTLVTWKWTNMLALLKMYVYFLLQKSKITTNTVQNIYPFSYRGRKFVACGVVHASPLQTIQCGPPLVRGRRALCISCMLGRRVVFETRHTRWKLSSYWQKMQITGIVEGTIWQGFEAELGIQKTFCFFLSISAQEGLFLLAIHSVAGASLPRQEN